MMHYPKGNVEDMKGSPMEIECKINYDKLEQAIAGDRLALVDAFSWGGTTQDEYYWQDQYDGRRPLDVETLKAMRKTPPIQAGKTYTDESGIERECIFTEGNKAYMRHKNGGGDAAYIWDVSTGKSICFGWGYNIDLTPKPVVESKTGTVTFTDGVADFSTWKEV